MKSQLLVVSRRFWPIWEESCQRLNEWTTMLQQQGVAVTVLTGRWHTSWPAESTCRDIRVVRLLPAPKSAWNETLFLRNLGTWVTKHRNDFDTVYVDESAALLHQLAHKHVIGDRTLIARYPGLAADDPNAMFPFHAISQACEGCRKADMVIAPTSVAHRQLQSSGILPNRIVRIPDIAWQPPTRDSKHRNAAARSLRTVNHDFTVPTDCKLLTYIGDLSPHESSLNMLDALIRFVEQEPKVLVWMLGVGSAIGEMHDRVKNSCVHHQILFQSPFDDWESILQLSDGLVFPSVESGAQYLMPQAIASGLPFIALESSLYRARIPEVLHRNLVKAPTAKLFGEAIGDWFHNHQQWLENSEIARQAIVAENIQSESRQAWLQLLRSSED